MGAAAQWFGITVVALSIAAAVQDLVGREIANGWSLGIVVLFLLTVLIGAWPLADVPGTVGAAAAVFLVATVLFAFGLFGGGDVKLLGAVSLWIAPGQVTVFILFVALAGGLVALVFALRLWVGSIIGPKQGFARHFFTEDQEKSRTIPYGLAIAAGVLLMWRVDAIGPALPGGAG
jgi:prepilin peptidase CpaA